MDKPSNPNYYELLNVSPGSRIEEIIGAFLEISRKFSIFPFASNSEINRIDQKFLKYKEAYHVLSKVEARLKYDQEIGLKNHSWLEGEGPNEEKIKATETKASLQDTLIRLTFSKHSLDSNDIEQFKIEKAARKFKKARNFIKMEKYHEAINLLRELINSGPRDANYHSYLGFALMKKGWASYAQVEFKNALELDPENLIANKYFRGKSTTKLEQQDINYMTAGENNLLAKLRKFLTKSEKNH